ncbi:unnamed protein product [Brassicogethes aeneus]|uniref:Uncharacterized protein n=1 Tax=Brassicogethes aeneus TaxID=1431903 RepID=A0A9P0BA07_BRAAE|nr:unnamed protein product [Brassicogethes aeneus]
MPLTPAEKQRRYRERRKNNPEKEAESRRKDRERYHAKKCLVRDLSASEHRAIKKKWRSANARRKNSPAPSDQHQLIPNADHRLSTPQPSDSRELTLSSIISTASRGRKKVHRNRSKLFRDNIKLKEQLEAIKKRSEKYKKRYNREKRKRSKIEGGSQENQKKYEILSNAIKKRYQNIKSRKEKYAIQKIFEEQAVKCSRQKKQLIQECLAVDQGYIRKTQPLLKKKALSTKIKDFFERDDISRATAGKKETVSLKKNKMQKRYLLDNMKNLYLSFKRENPALKCSYKTFTRYRPFYVLLPTVAARDTCLCRIHTNIQYLAIALCKNKMIPTSDLNKIIANQVCDCDSPACMTGICSVCQSNTTNYDTSKDEIVIKYPQWLTKTEVIEKSGKKIKVTKSIKEEKESTGKDLIDKFEATLKEFKRHIYYIKTQYRNYRKCIDDLGINEIALHIDFSENYSCKFFEEVQSHHFGGSRNQVSLHTGVMYSRGSNNKIDVSSFCTLSGNLLHNPAAIWAHLHPIFASIHDKFPKVNILHVFSDGPATQYRQKQNFYLICTKLFSEYKFTKVTWNFFEAGHGKGAADGIGGFLKRTADQLVARGTDISDATNFYLTLKNVSKVRLHLITNEDIEQSSKQIPEHILPLLGTMKVHQVFTEEVGVLKYRNLSCFCQRGFCSCMNPKRYVPLQHTVEKSISSACDNSYLSDISNLCQKRVKGFYSIVYNSDSEDDVPLTSLKEKSPNAYLTEEPSTSKQSDDALIEKENIHINKIKQGVCVLVKMSSSKQDYIYLGKALSEVEDDGEVKIMFFKSMDHTATKFKLVESDLSYVPFDNLIAIVPEPKKLCKGSRISYYQFDTPLNIFEK